MNKTKAIQSYSNDFEIHTINSKIFLEKMKQRMDPNDEIEEKMFYQKMERSFIKYFSKNYGIQIFSLKENIQEPFDHINSTINEWDKFYFPSGRISKYSFFTLSLEFPFVYFSFFKDEDECNRIRKNITFLIDFVDNLNKKKFSVSCF